MRVKWRIVVSFNAVFATHQLGPTYHSFSQSDCERKARGTAGRSNARRDSRRATGSANGSTSGPAAALCSPIQNFGSRVVETLEALAFTSIQSWIDSKAANRLAIDRNDGQSWGTTMPIDLFTVRNLKAASGLAFCLALLPATSHAFTQDDQRRLCTSDVFRLCASEIPSVERITACMHKQRASLSEGCRRVFGKPAEQSASAK